MAQRILEYLLVFRNAERMKFAVAQKRSVMALDAAGLPLEQGESLSSLCGKGFFLALEIPVERNVPGSDGMEERRDGLKRPTEGRLPSVGLFEFFHIGGICLSRSGNRRPSTSMKWASVR